MEELEWQIEFYKAHNWLIYNYFSMKPFILFSHATISLLFFVTVFVVITKSIVGLITKRQYSNFDKKTTVFCLIFLYCQFIFGFALYFINKKAELIDPNIINQNNLIRFWEVEHIILMLFAIAIAQIGQVIISNTKKSFTKYKKRLIYFSIVLIIVLSSLFLAKYK